MSFSALLESRAATGPVAAARDRAMARIVSRMVQAEALPGMLPEPTRAAAVRERALLFSDAPLAAFWTSVARGGREAWAEERERIRMTRMERVAGMPVEFRRDVSTSGAIRSLLPLYRMWGRVLIDANAAPDISEIAEEALEVWQAL